MGVLDRILGASKLTSAGEGLVSSARSALKYPLRNAAQHAAVAEEGWERTISGQLGDVIHGRPDITKGSTHGFNPEVTPPAPTARVLNPESFSDPYSGASPTAGPSTKPTSDLFKSTKDDPANRLSTGEVFGSVMRNSNMGKYATQGALWGGTFALGGSALFGATKIAAPNNSEVNNPVKNLVKGAMIGVAGGALMAATHSTAFSGITKMAGEHAAQMSKIQYGAKMVNGAMQSGLFKGALAASIIAGSGDMNFTKPLNPVF